MPNEYAAAIKIFTKMLGPVLGKFRKKRTLICVCGWVPSTRIHRASMY